MYIFLISKSFSLE